MDYILFGMKMDRRNKKEIGRIENKMEFYLDGVKMDSRHKKGTTIIDILLK